jgi:hypothetical protein
MGYRVYYNFSDGSTEDLLEKLYDAQKEAEEAAAEGASDYYQGRECLKEAGESYCEEDIVDWDIAAE